MKELLNAFAARAQGALGNMTGTRQGLITGYDPDSYSVKVMIMPEEQETGWIPLGTCWAGNGWGLAAGPMIGAQIEVDFDSGQIGNGLGGDQFYNDTDRCPGPPSGEFWLVQKTGSLLKFHNDGTVEVTAVSTMKYTATQHHFVGPVVMDNTLQVTQQIAGNGGMAIQGGTGAAMVVTGDMHSTGTITGDTDVIAAGKSGKGHTHRENGTGSNTNPPN